MTSTTGTRIRGLDGPGTASAVPELHDDLRDRLRSIRVEVDGVGLHAVTAGSGPGLLLMSGWPQTWYIWRHLLGPLAERFSVVALEARGVGRSDVPEDGYDTGRLAADAVAVMRELGHERFTVVGHDVGMWVGYALAADHPDTVERLVVAEAAIPGITASAPIFGASAVNDRLWHFGFNRLDELNEILVRGREHAFFSHQFRAKAATPASIPEHAVDEYVAALTREPERLRASFGPYRALDETMRQNERRREQALTIPVLAIGGEHGLRGGPAATMRSVGGDVTEVVIPGAGHFPAEEQPDAMLAALEEFWA